MWMDSGFFISITISTTRLDFFKWLATLWPNLTTDDRSDASTQQLDRYGVTAGVAGILIKDPRVAQRYRLPQGGV